MQIRENSGVFARVVLGDEELNDAESFADHLTFNKLRIIIPLAKSQGRSVIHREDVLESEKSFWLLDFSGKRQGLFMVVEWHNCGSVEQVQAFGCPERRWKVTPPRDISPGGAERSFALRTRPSGTLMSEFGAGRS